MVRLLFVLLLLLALPAHALNIAMVLWRGETAAEAGFRAELTRLGYQTTITVYNANQDRTALATMLRQQMLPKLAEYDYIYTFGTTATTMAKSLVANRKPMIFNAVSDPVGAGFLSEDKAQNSMVAGVSNMVPMALQLANASKYLPSDKRLLLPFNPREQNTLLVADMLINAAKGYQWQVATWRIAPDPKRLENELKRLQQDAKNDIVFLAADSYLLSIAPRLLNALNAAAIPTICSAELFVEHGCSVGTISSYEALGKMAAVIIHRHQQGTQLQDIPLQTDPHPKLVLGQLGSTTKQEKNPEKPKP
ncbi:ABC transporter substrate-binding protein [Aeromonas sp. 603696]|uniref:ABC transporter substrate-binding protein n=1 Tax=Aeromonas sp. 603696 TaxID=2712049 RepID=UPI003B9E392D